VRLAVVNLKWLPPRERFRLGLKPLSNRAGNTKTLARRITSCRPDERGDLKKRRADFWGSPPPARGKKFWNARGHEVRCVEMQVSDTPRKDRKVKIGPMGMAGISVQKKQTAVKNPVGRPRESCFRMDDCPRVKYERARTARPRYSQTEKIMKGKWVDALNLLK